MRRAFPEADSADLSWILNAYTLVFAASLVSAGCFADLRGRKSTFLLGLAMFLGGSLGCGLARHVATLNAARRLT